MANVKWSNNGVSILAAQLLVGATSLSVTPATGNRFPIAASGNDDWFMVTLVDVNGNREIVKCTLRESGSDTLTITRAQEGTTARQFEIDDIVSHRVTAQELNYITSTLVSLLVSQVLVTNFIASGRKVYLYENAAPTGWTIVSVTDKVLAVKGGSQAYNVSGGNTAGTWSQPDHTHTVQSHDHALQLYAGGYVGTSYLSPSPNFSANQWFSPTSAKSATPTLGILVPDNTWRMPACVGIIVTKT